MATDTSAPSSLEEALLELPQDDLDVLGAGSAPEGEQTAETAELETEPAETKEEEESPSAPSVFDLADANGLDLRSKYGSEEEAMKGLLHAARMVGQRNELAEWGKAIQERPEEVYKVLQQHLGITTEKQPAAKTEEEAAPVANDPEVAAYLKLVSERPQWDEDWLDQITTDEKGREVPVSGADPGIIGRIRNYRRWQAKMSPYAFEKANVAVKANMAAIENPADKKVKELESKLAKIEQATAQQESQRFALEIAAQNKDWMFNGGEIRQGNLSPAGQLFANTFDRLLAENPNTKNPRALADAARAMVAAHLQAQNAARAKKKPAETVDDDSELNDEPRSLREKMRSATGGKKRPTPLSASATGRGAGKRQWPTTNGRELTLEERMLQIIGKK